jgi:hypothetical protein
MCESETFGGSEKFLDEVHRKGHEVRKKMVYERKKERKKEAREKYLKVPLGWILGTIMRELNLSDKITATESMDVYHDRREMALAY